jgi:hypothetical protein
VGNHGAASANHTMTIAMHTLPDAFLAHLKALEEAYVQETDPGVPVQSMQKVPISCARKIKDLEEQVGCFAKQITLNL